MPPRTVRAAPSRRTHRPREATRSPPRTAGSSPTHTDLRRLGTPEFEPASHHRHSNPFPPPPSLPSWFSRRVSAGYDTARNSGTSAGVPRGARGPAGAHLRGPCPARVVPRTQATCPGTWRSSPRRPAGSTRGQLALAADGPVGRHGVAGAEDRAVHTAGAHMEGVPSAVLVARGVDLSPGGSGRRFRINLGRRRGLHSRFRRGGRAVARRRRRPRRRGRARARGGTRGGGRRRGRARPAAGGRGGPGCRTRRRHRRRLRCRWRERRSPAEQPVNFPLRH